VILRKVRPRPPTHLQHNPGRVLLLILPSPWIYSWIYPESAWWQWRWEIHCFCR